VKHPGNKKLIVLLHSFVVPERTLTVEAQDRAEARGELRQSRREDTDLMGNSGVSDAYPTQNPI